MNREIPFVLKPAQSAYMAQDASCAVITCKEQANPLNAVEAPLDVFGSPVVRVCFCDDHFRMFGETTEEHEKPDLVIEEH